jgi:hypothetical protein
LPLQLSCFAPRRGAHDAHHASFFSSHFSPSSFVKFSHTGRRQRASSLTWLLTARRKTLPSSLSK